MPPLIEHKTAIFGEHNNFEGWKPVGTYDHYNIVPVRQLSEPGKPTRIVFGNHAGVVSEKVVAPRDNNHGSEPVQRTFFAIPSSDSVEIVSLNSLVDENTVVRKTDDTITHVAGDRNTLQTVLELPLNTFVTFVSENGHPQADTLIFEG